MYFQKKTNYYFIFYSYYSELHKQISTKSLFIIYNMTFLLMIRPRVVLLAFAPTRHELVANVA
jgi:hypothetical protein